MSEKLLDFLLGLIVLLMGSAVVVVTTIDVLFLLSGVGVIQ